MKRSQIRIGVDYYPEHWDKKMWKQDVEQMAEAGVKIVRMAEFAWSRLEPEENEYHFEWLDEIIQLFAEKKIDVFLCPPTCTPPQWLFEKYPEVIQVDKSNHQISIGIRGHRCLNNPVYREKSQKIITKMVSRYKDNPWVIGYQIDNELEANHCCCPVCAEKFRQYVKKKYGTIEKVNEAYGNNVWSGEYSSFSQITPPFGEHQTWLNPSYQLDFNRYASESTVEYVNFQRKLIHSIDADALITTNNWLCENMPDFYDMFDNLDFVSYDNYPATVLPENQEDLYSHAFHLDLMRGIKKKNFWIMEQLSGSLGSWMPMIATLYPGMLEGYAMQAIAHGADTILHFRWRTAISGAEMFWHGIIDHSNIPGRRYQEFTKLCKRVNSLQEMEGSEVKNKVAILYSSEQEYGFKLQPQVDGMYYFTQLKAYHDAFTNIGVGIDIIDWSEDLSSYAIVVAPTLYITNDIISQNLRKYVSEGGTLIITNRSGVKDEYNKCIMESLPTVFSDLTKSIVKEYDPIGPKKQKLQLTKGEWKEIDTSIRNAYNSEQNKNDSNTCSLWCDLIEEKDTEVLARYDDNFYRGEAAITRNPYKEGETYYVGTVPDRITMISFAQLLAKSKDIEYVTGMPLGVERTIRQNGEKKWTFLFNNTKENQNFEWTIHSENGQETKKAQMKPFEMLIL